MRPWMIVALGFAAAPVFAQLTPYVPKPDELLRNYIRADSIQKDADAHATRLTIRATWIDNDTFWYRNILEEGVREYWIVTASRRTREPLFDLVDLAAQLPGRDKPSLEPKRLALENLSFEPGSPGVQFTFGSSRYLYDRFSHKLVMLQVVKGGTKPSGKLVDGTPSPDGKTTVVVKENHISLIPIGSVNKTEIEAPTTLERPIWSPDSKFIVFHHTIPGDRKSVSLIAANVPGTTRGVVKTRLYDQAGDKMDQASFYVLNPSSGKLTPFAYSPIDCGGYPWSAAPTPIWWLPVGSDQWSFLLEDLTRGCSEVKVVRFYPQSGTTKVVIDEKSATFIDTTKLVVLPLEREPAILWSSERDGWAHLYKINAESGETVQITRGNWVTRAVEDFSEDRQEIVVAGNGRDGSDPYFIDLYRVALDGSKIRRLTQGDGTHQAQWNSNHSLFIDTFSRVDAAPIHELRGRDGNLVMRLDQAETLGVAYPRPEPFAAKGRDGVTDVYGLIFKPTYFDPSHSYPVIEDIYAGPHDSFVPKQYRPLYWHQKLAELGFFVVQIDGMGTSNRGKRFHDICWKNIVDGGFPDRILWMQSAAKRYPQMDLTKVGVYGTSAGGQNSTAALLTHPEFYKVGVSSCGCHDNRIDKVWWNEQWMGYPVGKEYEEQSNITLAPHLQGNLLLMVGELDTNVPPESTIRLCDALIRAGKEFEFVILPGMDHTSGGTYGERKRRDFFVKHLLGVEPPRWNDPATRAAFVAGSQSE